MLEVDIGVNRECCESVQCESCVLPL